MNSVCLVSDEPEREFSLILQISTGDLYIQIRKTTIFLNIKLFFKIGNSMVFLQTWKKVRLSDA
jgi:hypothetical protein